MQPLCHPKVSKTCQGMDTPKHSPHPRSHSGGVEPPGSHPNLWAGSRAPVLTGCHVSRGDGPIARPSLSHVPTLIPTLSGTRTLGLSRGAWETQTKAAPACTPSTGCSPRPLPSPPHLEGLGFRRAPGLGDTCHRAEARAGVKDGMNVQGVGRADVAPGSQDSLGTTPLEAPSVGKEGTGLRTSSPTAAGRALHCCPRRQVRGTWLRLVPRGFSLHDTIVLFAACQGPGDGAALFQLQDETEGQPPPGSGSGVRVSSPTVGSSRTDSGAGERSHTRSPAGVSRSLVLWLEPEAPPPLELRH